MAEARAAGVPEDRLIHIWGGAKAEEPEDYLLRDRYDHSTAQTAALEGALDWSWDLLAPWAKAALSQVSVFRGGFSLSAAEQIIRVGSDKDTPAMFDILGELVDSSLLRRDQGDAAGSRYSLLESIRAYAHERLCEPGDALRGPEARTKTQEPRRSRWLSKQQE